MCRWPLTIFPFEARTAAQITVSGGAVREFMVFISVEWRPIFNTDALRLKRLGEPTFIRSDLTRRAGPVA
jgi:hypothetical protein